MSRYRNRRPMCAEYNERCGWCRSSLEHTQHEHDKDVLESIAKEGARSDALLRAAKKQYDAP